MRYTSSNKLRKRLNDIIYDKQDVNDNSETCNYHENDMDEIVSGLYLGNYKSSIDNKSLRKNNIRTIIRLVKELDINVNDPKLRFQRIRLNGYRYELANNITVYHFPIKDKYICKHVDPYLLFNITNKIIFNSLVNKKNVLVHCKRGHHRSGTVILAFLYKLLKLDYEKGISYVNSIRRCSLRRETCLTRALYKYYLKLNNKRCTNISCYKKDSYLLCKCN
jgi:protein-tyrosine phosphatase